MALLVISNSANKCIAQKSFLKPRQTNCYSRLPYCLRTFRSDLTRLAFDSHLIQSNAFESNASANANADESNANASANASAAKESSASANANAAFALAYASAFEHKPGGYCVIKTLFGTPSQLVNSPSKTPLRTSIDEFLR